MMKLLLFAALVQVAILQVQGLSKKPEVVPKPVAVKVKHELKCFPNGMKVTVDRLPFQLSHDLQLLDKNCKPKKNKKGDFVFVFQFDQCKTGVKTTASEIIFTNKVLGKILHKNDKISRIKDVNIALTCKYPREKVLSSGAIQPNQDRFRGASVEGGRFKFSILIFKDNKFTVPYKPKDYPIKKHLRERFHVQVKVRSLRTQLAILAQYCYATPKKHAGGAFRHNLIVNSCPADKTLKFHKSPSANIQRFSAQTFNFRRPGPAKYHYIYIHCVVTVCDGNKKNSVCAKGCQKKKLGKREESSLDQGIGKISLTQGPFAVQVPEIQQDESNIERADEPEMPALVSYN